MNEFDPIAAVETLYRTDLDSPSWLQAVMTAMRPLIDPQHHGVQGGLYGCPDPCSLNFEHVFTVEMGDRLRTTFVEGIQTLNEAYITSTFLSSGVMAAVTAPGWNELPLVREGALRAQGVIDAISLAAVEPDGCGLIIANFRSEPTSLKKPESHLTRRLFRHLGAAHRLQRKLRGQRPAPDLAAAVLDTNGRLHHARGAAKHPLLAEAIQKSVRQSEEARGQRRRREPHAALDAWESLVAGRWTLVDHFDQDGRRYILALENAQQPLGLHLLSPRERDVVERALLGAHNKAIAYDLGLAHSTIKVLMSRAAFKLGVRTRHELLAKLQVGRKRV